SGRARLPGSTGSRLLRRPRSRPQEWAGPGRCHRMSVVSCGVQSSFVLDGERGHRPRALALDASVLVLGALPRANLHAARERNRNNPRAGPASQPTADRRWRTFSVRRGTSWVAERRQGAVNGEAWAKTRAGKRHLAVVQAGSAPVGQPGTGLALLLGGKTLKAGAVSATGNQEFVQVP